MNDDGWAVRIVVLDRGFVKVCYCPDPAGYAIWLPYRDGRTVRRWGTTGGLAGLIKGPTASTVLDAPAPTGIVPVRAVIDIMDAEDEGWRRHLTPDSSGGATARSGSKSSRTGSKSGATP